MDFFILEILPHLLSTLVSVIIFGLLFTLYKLPGKIWLNSFIISVIVSLYDISSGYISEYFFTPSYQLFISIIAINYLLSVYLVKYFFTVDIPKAFIVGTIGFGLGAIFDVSMIYLFYI